MTIPPPDGSRDRRIEDPTNLWLVHPLARALLPRALALGVSANAVSFAGLALGVGAALCFARFGNTALVLLGLFLSVAWLVMDGLDGMVARATGTAGPLGRFLDGLVDHGVFILIYVAMATVIGTAEGWVLAVAAGAAHIVQSSLYEGERARFHRRARGVAAAPGERPVAVHWLVRAYDWIATLPDRGALPFERHLAASAAPAALGRDYAARAVPAMRVEALLSANTRVWLIALACLAGDPRLFWCAEIGPLSVVAILGLLLHRRIERGFAADTIRTGAGRPAALPTRETT